MASGQVENVVLAHELYHKAPPHLEKARGELGVTEYLSYDKSQANPRVAEYFKACGAVPDPLGTPWCAYFMGWCLGGGTKKGNARSYLTWGNPREGAPQLGDVVVLWRGPKNDGVTGHVGFFIREDGNYYYLLGGNQGDAVTEAKFSKSKVLGVRYARSMWSSKTNWAGGGTASGGIASIADGLNAPSVDQAVEAKGLFEQIMQYFPNWKIMLGVGVTVLGLYIIYNRNQDKIKRGE